MELLIDSDTVEPFVIEPRRGACAAPASPVVAQMPILKGLGLTNLGRALLGSMRWGIVAALVLSGYFGAALINAGVDFAFREDAGTVKTNQTLLATASPRQ